MSRELVYRMRTCAAALAAADGQKGWTRAWAEHIARDAAGMLAEASNLLDEPEELGEPMAKIDANVPLAQPGSSVTWTTLDLPTVTPRPCPFCGSIDARTARIKGRQLTLTCPKCSQSWEYRP